MSATATAPAPTAEPATEPAGKKPRRRLLLIVALVLLGALGAGGYLLFLGGGDDPAEEPVEEPVAEGPVVEVGTLTTNLAGAANRYARVGVALVLRADAVAADVESRFPLVKDAAITEIGRHEAATLQGADGTERLRAGLAEQITAVYPDGEVLRVVLTELLIQ
jgi:flagellar basal body-associated protein FliL